MKLLDLFNDLSGVEFRNITFGNDGGGIKPEHYKIMVGLINSGLIDLHTKFNLRERTIVLIPDATILNYEIKKDFLLTSQKLGIKYLDDSQLKYTDDWLRIISAKICDSNNGDYPVGMEVPIDDVNNNYSIRTIGDKMFRVPMCYGMAGVKIELTFRANAKVLVFDENYFPVETIEVELPDTHRMAFLYFIAARLYMPNDAGTTNAFHTGNNYMALYMNECEKLMLHGMELSSTEDNSSFERRGWA